MRPVRIDLSQIPSVDVQNLSRTFLSAVKKFYADPRNVAGFEEWKRQRDKQMTEQIGGKHD